MRTSLFIVLLLLAAILGGTFGYYLGYQRLLPRLSFVPVGSPTPVPSRVAGAASTPSASPSAVVSPTDIPQVPPQTVVDDFMKSFTQIKTTNTNDPNAQHATTFLTKDAQKVVSQEASGSIASGLARFAGVQSIPDGYTLGKPTTNGDTVVVATTWNYLSGPVTKVFYLVKEDTQWKIDTIRDK